MIAPPFSLAMLTDERRDWFAAAGRRAKEGSRARSATPATQVASLSAADAFLCHVHLHIGKLIPGVETSQFVTAAKIVDIPVPARGEGYWVHPQGNQFHVHTGEQVNETVLER